MNPQILSLTLVNPLDAGVLGTTEGYMTLLEGMTIIGLSVAPSVDDAAATLDLNEGATTHIAAVACATANTPGTWKSTHFGGTNEPIYLDADSVINFDLNSAAAGTAFYVNIYYLRG